METAPPQSMMARGNPRISITRSTIQGASGPGRPSQTALRPWLGGKSRSLWNRPQSGADLDLAHAVETVCGQPKNTHPL
eukprot:9469900-Pyramimonas_sp.AAC.2